MRILSEEGEGGGFFYVRVYIYIRYMQCFKLIGEGRGVLRDGRGEQHAVGPLFYNVMGCVCKRTIVIRVVVRQPYGDIEVRISCQGFVYAILHFRPIFSCFVLGQQAGKCIFFVGSQCTGVHVGLIVQLFQDFFHSFATGFRYSTTSMENAVYGSHRYIGHFGDVLNSYSFRCIHGFVHGYLCSYTIII